MNLITFSEPLTIAFRKSAGGATMTFEAGREYLIANAQLDRIMKDANVQQKTYKVSRAEMRIRNFHINAQTTRQRVLLLNGSGGYGDQIMTWPVAKILSKFHDTHILTDPGNNVCWWNFPWIKSVNTCPILWETVKMYDHFICFESVVNMDEHQDQMHPVDFMLWKLGFDPSKIPAEEKIVTPQFTMSEMGTLAKTLEKHKRVGLYQLSAANPVRCLPVNDSVYMAVKIAEATPDIHWLCLYDEFIAKEYHETLTAKATEMELTNLEAFCAPNLRELWALTRHSHIVVTPDSMMAHVAGVFETPCVGLWGPVAPNARMAYYKGHRPIWHKEFCPHAPCFAYTSSWPKYCPPREGRNVCDVLAGISPVEVVDAINEIAKK